MRRSMKRLKTFKHRPSEGAVNDPNVIPLEAIGGKIIVSHFDFARKVSRFIFVCFDLFFPFIQRMVPISKMCVCFVFCTIILDFCIFWIVRLWFVHLILPPTTKYITIHSYLKEQTNNKDDAIVSAEEEAQPTISEHISFAIGHLTTVICKHSYIISNIMMMVSEFLLQKFKKKSLFSLKRKFSLNSKQFVFIKIHFKFRFSTGLEYRIPQLVDVCLPSGGQFTLDYPESTQKYAPNQSVCGYLRWVLADNTVFVLYESDGRGASIVCRHQRHQIGSNRIYSIPIVPVWPIALENIIHGNLLVDASSNEIRRHVATAIIDIGTFGRTIPCNSECSHHRSRSKARNEKVQNYATRRQNVQIHFDANVDLDRCFCTVFLRHLWQRYDGVPYRLHGFVLDIHGYIPGKRKLTFGGIYSTVTNEILFAVVLARVEENDVHILGHCYRLFNAVADHDLYVSIRQIQWILVWLRWHQWDFVSFWFSKIDKMIQQFTFSDSTLLKICWFARKCWIVQNFF